jgi:hypothetical protein
MVREADSTCMRPQQILLVEHALRQLSRVEQTGWDAIPEDLHPAFARYMNRDVWTGECDLLTLREAALMIVRDAITRTGEFADGDEFANGSGNKEPL